MQTLRRHVLLMRHAMAFVLLLVRIMMLSVLVIAAPIQATYLLDEANHGLVVVMRHDDDHSHHRQSQNDRHYCYFSQHQMQI